MEAILCNRNQPEFGCVTISLFKAGSLVKYGDDPVIFLPKNRRSENENQ